MFSFNGQSYSKRSAETLAPDMHLNTDAVDYCLHRQVQELEGDETMQGKIAIVHADKLHSLRRRLTKRSKKEKQEFHEITTKDFIVLPFFDAVSKLQGCREPLHPSNILVFLRF